MGATMSNIQARLEVIEALLRGELSREEARSRTAAIKRPGLGKLVWAHIEALLLGEEEMRRRRASRGRLLLRIERIERAAYR